MFLFDIIRDWFVSYIWGGTLSNGNTIGVGIVGHIVNADTDSNVSLSDYGFMFHVYDISQDYEGEMALSFGDWLSTTSTIIVLILMCIFLFICVRYLFKVGAGLFSNLRG